MNRIVLVATVMMSTLIVGAKDAAPPAERPLPGIYAGGLLLCPLAELTEATVLSRPDPSDEGLPVLPEGTTALTVVAPSPEAQRLGVRPGALRLVLKKAEVDRYPYKVVSASVDRDPDDPEVFHLTVRAPLAPGSYRFGLERPEHEAGTDFQAVIRFLPCGFVVPAPPAAG